MAENKYPYTTVPGRLKDFLERVPSLGRPSKATQQWFASAGWAGGNARTVIPVLRFVGVIAQDGTPTELWDALRSPTPENRTVFAEGVRRAYAELFAMYPDAHRKDAEALRNFFRANTQGGDKVQTLLVRTFQTLISFGEFNGAKPVPREEPASPAPGKKQESEPEALSRVRTGGPDPTALTLNVNLQLQIPATTDAEVYETLFASMRKHLIDLSRPES
jgi:hypothetical protein